jgi:hypothetical protein
MQLRIVIGTGVVALVLAAAPLAAHHGFADYAATRRVVTGTLEQGLRLTQPHATLRLRVHGTACRVIFGAIAQFSDLREDTIPLGAVVTVTGQPHLDADRCDFRGVRVTWGEHTFEF